MDTLSHLVARENPNGNCTPSTCDASQSVYGYAPNLAATTIFLVAFALSGCAHAYQGLRRRTWFFGSAMVIGCLSEVLGTISRLILNNNPFSQTGFIMSVVLLTFAPAFFAGGIYYTLKHICLTFGSSFSRLKPMLYTYIFISCDFLSIMLQAIGGALASTSTTDSLLNAGTDIMIVGLAFQVVTLFAFGVLAFDYGFAVYRNRSRLNMATVDLRNSGRFKLFLIALTVAYLSILIRCAYRVAELSAGWGSQNTILRTQGLFIGLDSVPCALATIVLNLWHPGWCFPSEQKAAAHNERHATDESRNDKMMDDGEHHCTTSV